MALGFGIVAAYFDEIRPGGGEDELLTPGQNPWHLAQAIEQLCGARRADPTPNAHLEDVAAAESAISAARADKLRPPQP